MKRRTEGSSIEVIVYRMPQHKQNGCTVLFTRHQSTNFVELFRLSDWLSRYRYLKLEYLKICRACGVNGHHGTNILNQISNFSIHFRL